jgi:hypothetical protein
MNDTHSPVGFPVKLLLAAALSIVPVLAQATAPATVPTDLSHCAANVVVATKQGPQCAYTVRVHVIQAATVDTLAREALAAEARAIPVRKSARERSNFGGGFMHLRSMRYV